MRYAGDVRPPTHLLRSSGLWAIAKERCTPHAGDHACRWHRQTALLPRPGPGRAGGAHSGRLRRRLAVLNAVGLGGTRSALDVCRSCQRLPLSTANTASPDLLSGWDDAVPMDASGDGGGVGERQHGARQRVHGSEARREVAVRAGGAKTPSSVLSSSGVSKMNAAPHVRGWGPRASSGALVVLFFSVRRRRRR